MNFESVEPLGCPEGVRPRVAERARVLPVTKLFQGVADLGNSGLRLASRSPVRRVLFEAGALLSESMS